MISISDPVEIYRLTQGGTKVDLQLFVWKIINNNNNTRINSVLHVNNRFTTVNLLFLHPI